MTARRSSRFIRLLVAILLLLALAIYLPSLLLYWIHPGLCWLMGLLSIGFPYSWLAMVPVTILAFWLRKRAGWLLLLCWAAGWPIMRQVWGLHGKPSFDTNTSQHSLRVMQWNCMELSGAMKNDSTRQVRSEIVALLQQYQPDVLLLQDFLEINAEFAYSNMALLRDTLGYRFVKSGPYFSLHDKWRTVSEGSAIFSKIPFDSAGLEMYGGRRYSEQIVWADIRWQGRPLRLISTHLLSMNLNTPKGQPDPLYYHQREDSAVITSGNRLRKLRYYQAYHVRQARQLRNFLQAAAHPLVLGIDMNSVPSSWVYRHISLGLQDLFLASGQGWGRTYRSRLPNLRIDYLFTSTSLSAKQAITVPVSFSDHYPVVADLYWK